MLIYEAFYGYGMSVALRFCDDREGAKEIVHDAFLKVFAKLDGVKDESSFKPWFRRIIVNTSIDYYRKYHKESMHMDVAGLDAPDLNATALEQLSANDIYTAINQLPPAYKMVFSLYAVEGYKHDEISQRLGISVGTSKSNLSKARAKLQGILMNMNQQRYATNG